MNNPKLRHEQSLDELHLARLYLQDIYIPVLKKFHKGTAVRKDFVALKSDVDVAIIDLENASLGSITNRMKEALPDVKKAKKKLAKRIEELKKVQNVAQKITKVLGKLEKVAKLLL